MRLVGQRILHCLSGKLHPISKDRQRARRAMAAATICIPDLVNEPPLPIQRGVRRPQRIALIVDICSFGGSAVQLDDLESLANSKLVIAAVSNIVAPYIKARKLHTDFIKCVAKFLRVKVVAFFEDTTLAMIAGLNEAQAFASQ